MVNYQAALDETFAALADPTRRAILTRLAHSDSSVTELARPFKVSLPAISRQLRILRHAGLLTQNRHGRIRRCRLRAAPLRAASEWIEHYRRFWSGQLDALAEFLERPDVGTAPARARRAPAAKQSDVAEIGATTIRKRRNGLQRNRGNRRKPPTKDR